MKRCEAFLTYQIRSLKYDNLKNLKCHAGKPNPGNCSLKNGGVCQREARVQEAKQELWCLSEGRHALEGTQILINSHLVPLSAVKKFYEGYCQITGSTVVHDIGALIIRMEVIRPKPLNLFHLRLKT